MPGFTALLTGLGLAAAELGGELPLVITGDEEVSRVPVRAVNKPSQSFQSFLHVESAYNDYSSHGFLTLIYYDTMLNRCLNKVSKCGIGLLMQRSQGTSSLVSKDP